MRRIILLLLLGLCFTACIDKNYDLSKVTTDDITIGDESSEFRIPLATINISMDQFSKGRIDIGAIFKEADIWLPSGLEVVDLEHIDQHLDGLLTTLFQQLQTDDTKLGQLTDLAWTNYREEFMSLLQIGGQELTEEQFKKAFKLAIRSSAAIQVQDKARELARGYLSGLYVDTLSYDIDPIDIGSDIIDLLSRNLDPKGTPNPKNTLELYGSIQSALPVVFILSPNFAETEVEFSAEVDLNRVSEIPRTRLYEDDLRKIIDGTTLDMPVRLLRYYPEKGFSNKQTVILTIKLLKRGGLSVSL